MRVLRRTLLPAMAFLFVAALALPALGSAQSADALFGQAKSQARTEHKNILLVFSASWCGPCHLYEHFLDDPQMKVLTEKAFVVQRIDVGERKSDAAHADTPGGTALRSSLGAAREPGFPWLVITTPTGEPIVNSYDHGDKSVNIGYPVAPNEVDWYLAMLQKGAPQLSAADLRAIRAWFANHNPQ